MLLKNNFIIKFYSTEEHKVYIYIKYNYYWGNKILNKMLKMYQNL